MLYKWSRVSNAMVYLTLCEHTSPCSYTQIRDKPVSTPTLRLLNYKSSIWQPAFMHPLESVIGGL